MFPKRRMFIASILIMFLTTAAMSFSPIFTIRAHHDTVDSSLSTSIQASLIRVPEEVYSWQPALVFAYVIGDYGEVKLNVTVSVGATSEPSIPGLPLSWSIPYTTTMLPVSWAVGWYVTSTPGLPAETYRFEYDPPDPLVPPVTVTLTIRTEVHYELIVDGEVATSGDYTVLEGEVARLLPPLVFTTVYDVLCVPSILNETLGLGPKGWVAGAGEIVKTLIVAFDDKGIGGIDNVTFEYRVSNNAWIKSPVDEDPLMQVINGFISDVNSFLQWIEDAVRPYYPDFDLPEVLLPLMVAYAEIPGQAVGNYVMFRANATDVDENTFTSPTGFYHVVNKQSDVRILLVDPHVWLWLLQENVEQLSETLKRNIGYELPSDILGNITLVNKIADVAKKYGVMPFHHWEYLGKYYNLYIAWPNERLVGLLKAQAEGGFEPHVIFLSNLWLGFDGTAEVGPWNWDLRDIEVDGKSVLEHVIQFVKDRNAGFIASHGTLSDWVLWLDCKPSQHYKVGARGHVGDKLKDFNPVNEETVAALLGMPQLSLWEYGRDKVAEYLCKASEAATDPNVKVALKAAALMIGSLPLQVPYMPFNGTMRLTDEAKYVGWDIPEEFTVTIPSVYNEFGFNAYTQVGWQLAMPRALAYSAWWKANETRPLVKQLYTKLSKLMENATSRIVLYQNATKFTDEALEWGLSKLYRSIINANITGSTFDVALGPPDLNETLELAFDIGRGAYEELLQLLPVKLIALSKEGSSAIITHDKYWDPEGYRSVYFTFEVEAVEGGIAEKLLTQAVNWTLQWIFKNITELLGNLVRVPKDLAGSFNAKLDAIFGDIVLSDGVLLAEEGYTTVTVNVSKVGFLHLLIAHPTSDKLNVTSTEAEVLQTVNIMKGLSYITLKVHKQGIVKVHIKANPESSLNPAYISIKQEVDTTPPSTVISLSGALGENDWFTSDVTVTLSATDDTEVDKTEYSLDNISWITYVTPFTITNEGSTIIYYKSTDKADNIETTKSETIKIDKTSPIILITSPLNGSEIRSPTITVTWTGSDETSGISHYEIRLDGGLWINVGTDTTYTLTKLGDGSHTIEVRATDKAGMSKQSSVDFTVNTSPPFEPSYMKEVAILVALIIAVALGIALYFLKIRKH